MGDEVIKVLDHLGKQFGIAIDWTSANVMPYLQDLMSRIVKYGIYQNISELIYTFLILIIFIIITKKLYKLAQKYNDMYEETKNKDDERVVMLFSGLFVASLIATIVISIATLFGSKEKIDNIVELNTVPEKYVIEMIQDKIDENGD